MKMLINMEGSSSGFASITTPDLSKSLTSHGSDGAYVVKRAPSVFVPLNVRPSMTTFAIRPRFNSEINCEYSIGTCACCRTLNWLNTVIKMSAITSQMAIFLIRLFKIAPWFAPVEILSFYANSL